MAFALGLACAGSSAHAAVLVVDALADSSNSGLGIGLLDALTLTMGETFEVSASPDDLWSAGALPRWSNADGLTHDLFATGTDESGEPAGTLIGTNFGLLTFNGFSAPFGSLVGEIGTGPGSYRLFGTHFVGPAWAAGPLTLFYWDSFTADNSGSVAVTITAIPEPAAWSLMILGFGATGALLRRRRAVVA